MNKLVKKFGGTKLEVFGPCPKSVSHKNLLDFLKIRKATFVDGAGWDLDNCDGYEWDQYDLPFGRYVIAYEYGECVGGLRLHPTIKEFPIKKPKHRFMISDFIANGLVDPKAMEQPLLIEPSPNTWEMTRFISNNTATTKALLEAAHSYLRQQDVNVILTISPVAMRRMLSNLGYDVKAICSPIRFDGKNYQILHTMEM